MARGRVRRMIASVAGMAVVIGALTAIGAGLSGIDHALADMPGHRFHTSGAGLR